MSENNEICRLGQISTVLDDSEIEVILTTQSIKAQDNLLRILQQQIEQQKQKCNFMRNANQKMKAEIKCGEQEIKSSFLILETIKSANVELQKELLVTQERKLNITERVNNGIEKYEKLWQTSKKRYENIPFIKHYLQVKNKKESLQESIYKLIDEKKQLNNDINKRKDELWAEDKKIIIELANYMVNERPINLQKIKEKQEEINQVINEIKEGSKCHENLIIVETVLKGSNLSKVSNTKDEEKLDLLMNADEGIMCPKLKSVGKTDLDSLFQELDQIKKVDLQSTSIRANSQQTFTRDTNTLKPYEITKDDISTYFYSIYNEDTADPKTNYSDKKLINVLQDVKLDDAQVCEIVSKAKGSVLQKVDVISEDTREKTREKDKKVEIEEIEELDLTTEQTPDTFLPPTQFMDHSQNLQSKRVKFDEFVSVRDSEAIDTSLETYNESQPNTSVVSEASYKNIKESVFKKHNLDLSPQFKYPRNTVTSLNSPVTSKFFEPKKNNGQKNIEIIDLEDVPTETKSCENKQVTEVNDDNEMITDNEPVQDVKKNIPKQGFLFNPTSLGIMDSLNISEANMDYEDTDAEFPHIMGKITKSNAISRISDSTLLMSPKADDQVPSTSDHSEFPPEVPNYLSGFRKTAFSFFGNPSQDNSDSATQNQDRKFTFAFGGDKNTKGSLFNMFK